MLPFIVVITVLNSCGFSQGKYVLRARIYFAWVFTDPITWCQSWMSHSSTHRHPLALSATSSATPQDTLPTLPLSRPHLDTGRCSQITNRNTWHRSGLRWFSWAPFKAKTQHGWSYCLGRMHKRGGPETDPGVTAAQGDPENPTVWIQGCGPWIKSTVSTLEI